MTNRDVRNRKYGRRRPRGADAPAFDEESYKYCERCEYAPIIPGDKFCPSCGAEFDLGEEKESADTSRGSRGLSVSLKFGVIVIAALGLYAGLASLPDDTVSKAERNWKQNNQELQRTLDGAERLYNQQRCDAGVRSACFDLMPKR